MILSASEITETECCGDITLGLEQRKWARTPGPGPILDIHFSDVELGR